MAMQFAEPSVIETTQDYEDAIRFVAAWVLSKERTAREMQLLKEWAVLIHDYESRLQE